MNDKKQPAMERAGGRAFQVEGKGKCQDPEARKSLVCLRNRQNASVVETSVCAWERVRREGSEGGRTQVRSSLMDHGERHGVP